MFNFSTNKKKAPENLKGVLEQLKKLDKSFDDLSQDLKNLKEENKRNLRKVGLVRFNPFKELGGDQSFSVAVLDEEDNGFVITSHYGREANRVYAKPVNNGKSSNSLSNEEKEAINKAIENK